MKGVVELRPVAAPKGLHTNTHAPLSHMIDKILHLM